MIGDIYDTPYGTAVRDVGCDCCSETVFLKEGPEFVITHLYDTVRSIAGLMTEIGLTYNQVLLADFSDPVFYLLKKSNLEAK